MFRTYLPFSRRACCPAQMGSHFISFHLLPHGAYITTITEQSIGGVGKLLICVYIYHILLLILHDTRLPKLGWNHLSASHPRSLFTNHASNTIDIPRLIQLTAFLEAEFFESYRHTPLVGAGCGKTVFAVSISGLRSSRSHP
jgi:hypothetical protein